MEEQKHNMACCGRIVSEIDFALRKILDAHWNIIDGEEVSEALLIIADRPFYDGCKFVATKSIIRTICNWKDALRKTGRDIAFNDSFGFNEDGEITYFITIRGIPYI